MKKYLAMALFLTASMNVYAVNGGAVLGGAIGGATGAAVGYNLGGQGGAILGGALGGATGAAIGSSNNAAPVVQAAPIPRAPVQAVSSREDEEGDRHDNGRHLGHEKGKHNKHHNDD